MYVFTTIINVLTIQNKKNKEKIINGTGFLIEKKISRTFSECQKYVI